MKHPFQCPRRESNGIRRSDRTAAMLNRNQANRLLSYPMVQQKFVDLIHDPSTVSKTVRVLQKIGRLEDTLALEQKLPRTQTGTIAVLNAQIDEILTTEFSEPPCT